MDTPINHIMDNKNWTIRIGTTRTKNKSTLTTVQIIKEEESIIINIINDLEWGRTTTTTTTTNGKGNRKKNNWTKKTNAKKNDQQTGKYQKSRNEPIFLFFLAINYLV